MLVENFNDKVDAGVKNKKELNSLIIFDDVAYSDKFKAQGKDDTIKKIFMNGRKFLVSTIVISQKNYLSSSKKILKKICVKKKIYH